MDNTAPIIVNVSRPFATAGDGGGALVFYEYKIASEHHIANAKVLLTGIVHTTTHSYPTCNMVVNISYLGIGFLSTPY